jgi:hypothetical protein
LLCDYSAKRMSHDMGVIDTRSVHNRKRVFGHLLDCQRNSGGLALAHSAIVKGQAPPMISKRLRLRKPSIAVKANPLNPNDGLS